MNITNCIQNISKNFRKEYRKKSPTSNIIIARKSQRQYISSGETTYNFVSFTTNEWEQRTKRLKINNRPQWPRNKGAGSKEPRKKAGKINDVASTLKYGVKRDQEAGNEVVINISPCVCSLCTFVFVRAADLDEGRFIAGAPCSFQRLRNFSKESRVGIPTDESKHSFNQNLSLFSVFEYFT